MAPILHLGPWSIESYALMNHLGFFAAISYGWYRFVHTEHLDRFQVLTYMILIFFVQIIGGSLIPFIYKWHLRGYFPSNLMLTSAGRYFHSVLLSTVLFTAFFAWWKKWPVARVLDHFAVATVIMSGIGRIGCFLTGCCSGKPTDVPWAVRFPFEAEHVHPTQLYHFFFETFILLSVLLFIDKHRRYSGQTFLAFMFIYSMFRFSVEFLRTNPVALWGLTHAQLFSLFAFVVTGIILAYKHIMPVKTSK